MLDADRGNLLVTRFDSSRSHSATIQTFILDKALEVCSYYKG